MAWPIDIVFDRVLLFHNDRWVTLSLNLVNDRTENSRRPTRFPFGQLPLNRFRGLSRLKIAPLQRQGVFCMLESLRE